MMTKRFKLILKGVGSVMDIYPSLDYRQFVPGESPQERTREHLVRIGAHLKNAVNRFANEQQKEKTS